MNNVTTLKRDDGTTDKYQLHKIEVVVEEHELEEALAALFPLGIAPPITYPVR